MLRAAVASVLLAQGAVAQLPGMPGMPTEAKPIHKSAKLLECAVCKRAADEIHAQAAVKRAAAPYGKLGEDELQEIGLEVCDPDLDGGEWITFLDVVQDEPGDRLKLQKEEYLGECRRECRTVVKACRAVMDEHREDIAEALYKAPDLTAEKFRSRLCTKWSKTCPEKAPPAGYVHPDEYWMPVDEEMYRMKKMQQAINKQADKYGKQPVQFVDPMNSMMYADEDEF